MRAGAAAHPVTVPEGINLNELQTWLPEAPNQGWTYRDRVPPDQAGMAASAFYADRHRHSDLATWQARLAAGEIRHNGQVLLKDAPLAAGDRLAWQRPPWLEGAVPAAWAVIYDDGDLHVIDKPAGLPVLPAGGWLEHTLLRLLEQHHGWDPGGVPRPVHRLGRFTSGLLVCARQPATRAWLSAQLRESTLRAFEPAETPSPTTECRKVYRAWVEPGSLSLAVGESRVISTPIGRRQHPLLGTIWCACGGIQNEEAGASAAVPAHSAIRLIAHRSVADLVEVTITSGRPHQIRIHCAAIGAPLLGDPLYLPGGLARSTVLPGEGGYQLRAHRLRLTKPDGEVLQLQALLTQEWRVGGAAVRSGT